MAEDSADSAMSRVHFGAILGTTVGKTVQFTGFRGEPCLFSNISWNGSRETVILDGVIRVYGHFRG